MELLSAAFEFVTKPLMLVIIGVTVVLPFALKKLKSR